MRSLTGDRHQAADVTLLTILVIVAAFGPTLYMSPSYSGYSADDSNAFSVSGTRV